MPWLPLKRVFFLPKEITKLQVFGLLAGRMVPFLENAMSHTSILIILAISFERYHAINSPFEVLYACTKKRAVKIISGLWVCGLMSALPMVFISHTEQAQHVDWGVVEVCRTPIHNFWRTFYVVAIIVLFFILPGIILVVIYVSMCSKMLQDTNRQRNHSSNVTNHDILNSLKVNTFSSHHNLSLPSLTTQRIHRIRLSHKQVVYMLITIIVMFFICLIPIKVMILVGIFTSVERMERLGIEAYLNLMSFARIMFYINSAVNPVLYNIVSTKFRHAFYKSFFCVLKSPHVEHSVMNGNLPRRGHYTPYYRRSMGSKTWYSEFELYHNRSDASSGKLKDKIMATNEIWTSISSYFLY